jgi:hypothetical protein
MQPPVATAGDNRFAGEFAPCIKNSSAMAAVVSPSKNGTNRREPGKTRPVKR